MGTQVLSTSQEQSKVNMAVSTVLAGSVAVAAGNLLIWIGNGLNGNQLEIVSALQRCRDTLREAGHPDPGAGDEVYAISQPGAAKVNVSITNQAATPTIAETDVLIGYGAGYAGPGSTLLFYTRIDEAIEVLLESTLKVA